MKDTIYFSHDFNARNDPKIIKLRVKYNWKGYGLFWAILEIMREENGKLSHSDIDALAFQLHSDINLDEFISFCIEIGLFKSDNKIFWSERLQESVKQMRTKSAKARESAKKRWSKSEGNANASRTQSEGNAKKESKGKEIKEKEEKENSDSLMEDFKKEELEKKNIPESEKENLILTDRIYRGFRKSFPDNYDLPCQKTWEWIRPIRELRKNYTTEQIIAIAEFAIEDDFWNGKVMDAKKLREKFETLKIQYQEC